MRLVALFVSIPLAVALAAAAVNYRVDPLAEFYNGTPYEEALEAQPHCLVANEVIGGAGYMAFKQDVFRRRHPSTVVIGSSRVLKISSRPGERGFANLGMPQMGTVPLLELMRALDRMQPRGRPLTLYLGIDFFWFNPRAPKELIDPPFHQSFFEKTAYLLSRDNLRRSARLLRDSRTLALRGWQRERFGRYCVIDRGTPDVAWRVDGSRLWNFELDPRFPPRQPEPFTTDLTVLRTGLYGHWNGFAWGRLRQLREAVELARERGWRVVGFVPPDGARFVRLFSTDPTTAGPWRTFARVVPEAFERFGYPFLDFRRIEWIPCPESDFVDGGNHTDARCSARMRARLDAAARSPATTR
jgi:hypothetical protein